MMDKLKPVPKTKNCPFCGKQPEVARFNMHLNYSVVWCYRIRCKANPMIEAETTLKAIKLWNTRHAG